MDNLKIQCITINILGKMICPSKNLRIQRNPLNILKSATETEISSQLALLNRIKRLSFYLPLENLQLVNEKIKKKIIIFKILFFLSKSYSLSLSLSLPFICFSISKKGIFKNAARNSYLFI